MHLTVLPERLEPHGVHPSRPQRPFGTPARPGHHEQLGEGRTEQIIGRWFAQGGDRRDKTILATKAFGPMGDAPNTSGLSALHIRRACEASLRRLQTDYIDVYQMHHIDRNTPWDEIWEALSVLRQQGKVLYSGSPKTG